MRDGHLDEHAKADLIAKTLKRHKATLDQLLDDLPPDVQAARNRQYGSCLREREDALDEEPQNG